MAFAAPSSHVTTTPLWAPARTAHRSWTGPLPPPRSLLAPLMVTGTAVSPTPPYTQCDQPPIAAHTRWAHSGAARSALARLFRRVPFCSRLYSRATIPPSCLARLAAVCDHPPGRGCVPPSCNRAALFITPSTAANARAGLWPPPRICRRDPRSARSLLLRRVASDEAPRARQNPCHPRAVLPHAGIRPFPAATLPHTSTPIPPRSRHPRYLPNSPRCLPPATATVTTRRRIPRVTKITPCSSARASSPWPSPPLRWAYPPALHRHLLDSPCVDPVDHPLSSSSDDPRPQQRRRDASPKASSRHRLPRLPGRAAVRRQGAPDTRSSSRSIHHTQCGNGFLAGAGFAPARRGAASPGGPRSASAVSDPHRSRPGRCERLLTAPSLVPKVASPFTCMTRPPDT